MNVFPGRNEESITPLIQILSIGNRQIGKGLLLIIEQVIDIPVPPSVVLVIREPSIRMTTPMMGTCNPQLSMFD